MITNITTSAGVNNSTSSETWKPVVGYEGLYEISSMGRVKSLKRTIIAKNGTRMEVEEKLLAQSTITGGYLSVCLSDHGECRSYPVHRLVAMAFIPNPKNLSDVNHKDEDKTNNSVENLEWMTHKENLNYGTYKERMALAVSKPVCQIDKKTGVIIAIYPGQKFAEEATGICSGTISNVCRGIGRSAGGYYWKFSN